MPQNVLSLGICSWFGFSLPLPERLGMIKKAGFTAVSLWWGDEEYHQDVAKADSPGMARDLGLSLDHIHVPYHNCNDLWSEEPRLRQALLGQYQRWLEDCVQFKIPTMVLHIAKGLAAPAPGADGLAALGRLVQAAEKAEVTIAVENTRGAELLETVFTEIVSPRLGLCYDSSHDWLCPRPLEILGKLGSRLVTTHISDNDGLEDRHWLPSAGIVEWLDLSRIFPWDTYQGTFLLEVLPREEDRQMGPGAFLTKALQDAVWVRGLKDGHTTTESKPDSSRKKWSLRDFFAGR